MYRFLTHLVCCLEVFTVNIQADGTSIQLKSTWDRQWSLGSSQVHLVPTNWGLTLIITSSQYCQSIWVCKATNIWDLSRSVGLTYICHGQAATSVNSGWYLVRLGPGEKWKLMWHFGTPIAATSTSLLQFESCSLSAQRKQDCSATNKQKTNCIYSLKVQCLYSTSCLV